MTAPIETSAARSRRRWVTFGEIVAVLALLISAASFWDAHQDHVRARQTTTPAAVPAAPNAPLLLSATISDDRQQLTLHPAHAEQVIETQTLHFPAAVRAAPVETTGNPRIEAGWFEDGLRHEIKAAKAGDRAHRLAVGIETSFVVDGVTHSDRAIYDIGYELRPRFMRGAAVDLEGVSLVRAHVGGDLQAQVEARWGRQR